LVHLREKRERGVHKEEKGDWSSLKNEERKMEIFLTEEKGTEGHPLNQTKIRAKKTGKMGPSKDVFN